MKKTITFAIMALIALTSQAQLKVDSLGRIKVGSLTGTYGNSYNATIGTTRYGGGLYIYNPTSTSPQYGLNVNLSSSYAYPIAIDAFAAAGSQTSMIYGVRGVALGGYNPYKSVGVMGATESDPFTIFTAGIVGATTHFISYPDSGNYAGYFYGDVLTTGSFLGTLLSPGIILSQGDGVLSTNGRDGSGMQVVEKLQSVDLL